MFLNYLKTGEAYQVELIRRNGRYYCHITFDEAKVMDYKSLYTGHCGMLGIDTNPDGLGVALISRDGNYKESIYLKQPELQYARSSRRENLCGELSKQIIVYAVKNECAVAIEDLKFRNDRDVGSKFSRIKHQFIYRTLLTMLETACIRAKIEIIKVKPQFTSKIGLYKYSHQYGLDVHNAAAVVIARRAYGFKEKVPITLKDKLIPYRDSFEKKTEWAQWAIINNIIKKKGGTGFWMQNRKQVLGLEKP
jgi:IS605 OrfB family transposase